MQHLKGKKRCVQAKMKQPIAKKKLAAMKEREMEQQKLTFLKSVNERMELQDKRKKVDHAEDKFVAAIADELRQLPHRERLLGKIKSKIHHFDTNCRFWINKMLCRVISTLKMSTIETVLFLS